MHHVTSCVFFCISNEVEYLEKDRALQKFYQSYFELLF